MFVHHLCQTVEILNLKYESPARQSFNFSRARREFQFQTISTKQTQINSIYGIKGKTKQTFRDRKLTFYLFFSLLKMLRMSQKNANLVAPSQTSATNLVGQPRMMRYNHHIHTNKHLGSLLTYSLKVPVFLPFLKKWFRFLHHHSTTCLNMIMFHFEYNLYLFLLNRTHLLIPPAMLSLGPIPF